MVVMSLLNFIHIPFDEIQLLSLSEGLKKKNLAISQSYSIPLCPWLLQIDQIKHIQSDDLR